MTDRPLTRYIQPGHEPLDIDGYERAGGYRAMRQAIAMGPEAIIEAVGRAKLRGRGGAGFPTGRKWEGVPKSGAAPQRRYLIVNADEMEPGSFKDRLLLEAAPHLMIEGVIIGAFAAQAEIAYIFVRGEYVLAIRRLVRAVAEAAAHGYLGNDILGSGFSLTIHVHGSGGRYICGEASALFSALEGHRAVPRSRPPRSTTSGLWGRPSLVNNVETLCCVPSIVERGADWFLGLSRSATEGGTKLYGVSGRVKRPGLWELPVGTPLIEILEEHAGGMREGYEWRAAMPGGASTAFIMPENFDVAMDFDSVGKAGSWLGTGNIMVLDQKRCPVGMLHNIEQFFARESCGWCTPCRDGLPWVERILAAIEAGEGEPADLDLLAHHTELLGPGGTFCDLAPGAMAPLRSGLKFFRAEFEQHISERCCPWHDTAEGWA
ncbi:MAG TPA: NADH-ubiquinone oxidoreductase-F iron-sulfur binding region domain-containing protein [Acidiphilium sp.]|nr:NADH-quinone oxidoreductase subunit F [Steroidobacteraceae bacterium]OYV68747.1 MAG: NADH-quinone oxidoreductase subunit F [Acidiphilium sp. 21-60-14]OYV89616.1 MAG: NADH-quinone oxidoreductase subunit F [Acidiphilium sp. 37-60-79]OZB39366.1 MAG: NADH-quinone oxidoreductase subunit F [Acidiphilium sp. 34-60-192]HQT88764.1 NADH-ubiquinone oxidoreductase-F iron-sulfur binding region domain-containing protein [Acidiphilium sp.]